MRFSRLPHRVLCVLIGFLWENEADPDFPRLDCRHAHGWASTSGRKSNKKINEEDLRALRSHGIWSCLPLIYLKYLFKIWGFVVKRR